MKKLFFICALATPTVFQAMIISPKQKKINPSLYLSVPYLWRHQFNTIDKEDLNKRAGYDMQLTLLEDNRSSTKHGRPTVKLHGYGDNVGNIIAMHKHGYLSNPGDVIVFSFKDAASGYALKESNFGQEEDIRSTILVLSALHRAKIKAWDTDGHSRGGATATNTIGVLNKPTTYWLNKFKEFGLVEEEQIVILKKMECGTVLLNCPLQNVKTVINSKIEECVDACTLTVLKNAPSSSFSIGSFLNTISLGIPSALLSASRSSSIASTESIVEYSILPLTTGYKPWGEEAITSLDKWDGLKMKTLLHFQLDDEVISNKDNVEFAKKLIKHNPMQTFVVLGNNGGHNYGFVTIEKVINNFNFRNSGSYHIDKSTDGAEILDQSQPTVDTVEKYFDKK
jgi:hypothetical protein